LHALKALKKAGIIGVFVGDSGFLCGEICNLIEESGHQFIFTQAQHQQVKQRGKNAKINAPRPRSHRNYHRRVENDFGTGIAHAAEFHVNATMTVCTALAYNIKNSFVDFHKIQLRQGERMKLSTFQSRWLRIPGLFSRSGNRRILRIQQAAQDQFARLQIAA
jgi:hypothetical protein